MKQVLNSCLTSYKAQAHQKGITLAVDHNSVATPFLCDAHHLERILQNLVSNTIKFSNAGTRVTIGTIAHADMVRFYVRDQGPGISAKDQEHMFKKFRKLSARPTQGESSSGLGLSIVKALMNELNGTIAVESEVGVGTTFICSLPVK